MIAEVACHIAARGASINAQSPGVAIGEAFPSEDDVATLAGRRTRSRTWAATAFVFREADIGQPVSDRWADRILIP